MARGSGRALLGGLTLAIAGAAGAQVPAEEDDPVEAAVSRSGPAEREVERAPVTGLFGRAHLGAPGGPAEVRVDGVAALAPAAPWADLPCPEAAVVRVTPLAGASDAEDPGFRPVLLVQTLRAEEDWLARAELRWAPAFLSAAPSAPLGSPAAVEGMLDAAPPDPAWQALRVSLALGGPVVPGTLAVAASAQLARRAHQPPDPRSLASSDGTELAALRLTLGSVSSTRLTVGLTLDRSRSTPLCRRCDAAAASIEESAAGSLGVALEQSLDAVALLLHLSASLRRSDIGPASDPAVESHTDLGAAWTSRAPGRLGPDLPWSRLATLERRIEGHLRLSGGDERLHWKAGLQAAVEDGVRSGSVPGGDRVLERGAPCAPEAPEGCLARVTVEPGTPVARTLRLAGYAQLAWTPVPALTVWAGVRVDAGKLELPGGPSPWLTGIGPRATVAWDIAGDRKHLVIAHFGRAYEVGSLDLAFRAGVQPLQRAALYEPSGATFADCAVPGPRCLWAGGNGGTRWRSLGAPRLDELTAGYHAVVSRAVRAGVDVTLRWVDDLWEEQEQNRLRDATGALSGSADGTFRSVRLVGTLGRAWQRHQAVDAWLQAHPGPFDARLGYTLSWTSGTAADSFDDLLRDAPRAALASGFLPADRRHVLQAAAEVELLPGVFLGARLRYASGTPLWQTVADPGDPGARIPLTPRGTAAASGGTLVAVRNPETLRLDLEARTNLSVALGFLHPEIELAALVVNALGSETPTLLSASPGHVGAVLARQAPRHAELRLRIAY